MPSQMHHSLRFGFLYPSPPFFLLSLGFPRNIKFAIFHSYANYTRIRGWKFCFSFAFPVSSLHTCPVTLPHKFNGKTTKTISSCLLNKSVCSPSYLPYYMCIVYRYKSCFFPLPFNFGWWVCLSLYSSRKEKFGVRNCCQREGCWAYYHLE